MERGVLLLVREGSDQEPFPERRKWKPVYEVIQQSGHPFCASSLTERKQSLMGVWWKVGSRRVGILCVFAPQLALNHSMLLWDVSSLL